VAAVLVHIDLDGDRPHGSSLTALAAGRRVASSWGATLYAAVIVHAPGERGASDSTARVVSEPGPRVPGIEELEVTLARAGADRVVVALTDTAVQPLWASAGSAWLAVLDHLRPRVILFGADAPSAVELGPRTAARLGARLLMRARANGSEDIELQDRDGGYARASDGGAAVALIGGVQPRVSADPIVEVIVLAAAGGADPRIELAGTSSADVAQTSTALIAIGDDVKDDAAIVRDAARLATLLGASVLGGSRSTAIAPEVCVAIGAAAPEVAGATSLIRIGPGTSKLVDGALGGKIGPNLADLCRVLESS
jgi:hypothetical protein